MSTAAEKLFRLDAEATPGPWKLWAERCFGPSDESLSGIGYLYPGCDADARLIVAMRSLANPLAKYLAAKSARAQALEPDDPASYPTLLRTATDLDLAESALLAAIEAAMKDVQP